MGPPLFFDTPCLPLFPFRPPARIRSFAAFRYNSSDFTTSPLPFSTETADSDPIRRVKAGSEAVTCRVLAVEGPAGVLIPSRQQAVRGDVTHSRPARRRRALGRVFAVAGRIVSRRHAKTKVHGNPTTNNHADARTFSRSMFNSPSTTFKAAILASLAVRVEVNEARRSISS